jgi:hypothetical protein
MPYGNERKRKKSPMVFSGKSVGYRRVFSVQIEDNPDFESDSIIDPKCAVKISG